MSQISSINFKKSNSIQTRHNDRDLPPNYLIGGENEVNRNHKEALSLRNQIIAKAMRDYHQHIGQKFKAKSFEWSAVVNLKPESTMQDLEKLAKHFSDKYGFQCYQIAIHRDEGHIDELGEKIINHHAHLEFITLDKETGKSLFRAELQRPKALRQMQTEVAEILQMERGQDKRISKRQRIEPRKYAQIKEQERKNINLYKKENAKLHKENQELGKAYLSEKEKNALFEAERKKWIDEGGHTKEDYQALSAIKKEFKSVSATPEMIWEKINELKSTIKAKNDEILLLKQESDKLSEQNQDLNFMLENAKNELILAENNQTNTITSKKYKIDLRADFVDELIDYRLSPVISALESVNDEKRLPNERLNDLNDFNKRQNKLYEFSPQLHQIILDKYFKSNVLILREWCSMMKQKLETLFNEKIKRSFSR